MSTPVQLFISSVSKSDLFLTPQLSHLKRVPWSTERIHRAVSFNELPFLL